MKQVTNNWIAFILKDRFAKDTERESLKGDIISNFGLCDDDVYYIPIEINFAYSNYIFVRERNEDDLHNIYEKKKEAFEHYQAHVRITDAEFCTMLEGLKEEQIRHKPTIKYGDIVIVKNGKYNRLYGIALREYNSTKFNIGFKFCFGNVIEQYSADELNVVGNIFNYLKVID